MRDKHASRNAMLPVVTAFVLAVAFILDGGVITETIFSWPGMGLTLLNAALVEDIPMVIGRAGVHRFSGADRSPDRGYPVCFPGSAHSLFIIEHRE